jgi:hypothetical protein
MPIRVHLQFVTSAMRLARPITDPGGALVAGAGTQLTDGVVRVLRSMAIQSVVVMDTDAVRSWEAIKPLDEELRDLAERFGPDDGRPRTELRTAIVRHLTARATRLATEPEA